MKTISWEIMIDKRKVELLTKRLLIKAKRVALAEEVRKTFQKIIGLEMKIEVGYQMKKDKRKGISIEKEVGKQRKKQCLNNGIRNVGKRPEECLTKKNFLSGQKQIYSKMMILMTHLQNSMSKWTTRL